MSGEPRPLGLQGEWDGTARMALLSWMAGNEATRNVLLDNYRDEVAHALAERLRDWCDCDRSQTHPEHCWCDVTPGAAADFIDPEVT